MKRDQNKENLVFRDDDIVENLFGSKQPRYMNQSQFESVNIKIGRNSHLIKNSSKLKTPDLSDNNQDGIISQEKQFQNVQFMKSAHPSNYNSGNIYNQDFMPYMHEVSKISNSSSSQEDDCAQIYQAEKASKIIGKVSLNMTRQKNKSLKNINIVTKKVKPLQELQDAEKWFTTSSYANSRVTSAAGHRKQQIEAPMALSFNSSIILPQRKKQDSRHLSKPKSLIGKEEGRDLVGLTAFNPRRKNSTTMKNSGFQNMTKQSFGSLRIKNQKGGESNMGTYIGSNSGATAPFESFNAVKKEKNQVIITMNCTKAIPIPGYQQICNLMQPYKPSLQGQLKKPEVNVSDMASISQMYKQNQSNKVNAILQNQIVHEQSIRQTQENEDNNPQRFQLNTLLSASSVQIQTKTPKVPGTDTVIENSRLKPTMPRRQRPQSSYLPKRPQNNNDQKFKINDEEISITSGSTRNVKQHMPNKSLNYFQPGVSKNQNNFTQSSRLEQNPSNLNETGIQEPETGFKGQRGQMPVIDPVELKQLHQILQSGSRFDFYPKQSKVQKFRNQLNKNTTQNSDGHSRNLSGSSHGGSRNRLGFGVSATRLMGMPQSPTQLDTKSQGTVQGIARSYLSKSITNQFEHKNHAQSRQNQKSPDECKSDVKSDKNQNQCKYTVRQNQTKLKKIMDFNQRLLGSDILHTQEEHWEESDGLVEADLQEDEFDNYNNYQGVSDTQKIMMKQFPRDVKSQQSQLYERAIKKYEIDQSKTEIAIDEVERKSQLKLIHFHIEAFDNQIAMNRIDPRTDDIDDIQYNIKMLEQISENEEAKYSVSHSPNKFSTTFDLKKNTVQNFKNLSVITDIPKKATQFIKTPIQDSFNLTGYKGFTTNEDVAEDLFDDSPDVRKMDRRKSIIMDYMKRAVAAKLSGFQIQPKIMEESACHVADSVNTTRFGGSQGGHSSIFRQFNENRKFQKLDPSQNRGQLDRRTILRTREIDDNVQDYLSMDIDEFKQLKYKEAAVAYTQLMKVSKPIFSGSVDPMINKLNHKKIQQKMKSIVKRDQITETEIRLIEEHINHKKLMEEKKLLTGLWEIQNPLGSTPCSREGSTGCMIFDKIYLFGGFANDIQNDFKCLDMSQNRWSVVSPDQSRNELPQARFSHTMNLYKEQFLVIFGGASTYLKSIKMRLCLNDLHIFDVQDNRWTKIDDQPLTPKSRMGHVSQIFGSMMLVQGGFSTDTKQTLSDFNLFDIEDRKWIVCQLYQTQENEQEANVCTIQARQNHTMQAIYDGDLYDRISMFNNGNQQKIKNRAMWVHSKQMLFDNHQEGPLATLFLKKMGDQIKYDAGFYIFGGQDSKSKYLNDLWLLEPYYEKNKKLLNTGDLNFKSDQKLCLKASLITDFQGQPPCPRINAASSAIKNQDDEFLLIIYGGRNEAIFPVIGNVALNDICIYNVNFKTWTSLVIYGMQPCSRWSSVMMPNRKYSPDGIIIFGGVNLNNYCRSRLFSFSIVNFGQKMGIENNQPLNDQSPEDSFQIEEKTSKPQSRQRSRTMKKRLDSLKISPMKQKSLGNASMISGMRLEDVERDDESIIDANVDSYNQHKLLLLQNTVKDRVEIIKDIIKNYNEGNEKLK